MTIGVQELSPREALALLAGDREVCARIVAGGQFRVPIPLRYPGRRGHVVLHLKLGPAVESGPRSVRISEGGELIQALDEQGLELETDLVLSKTVYHAVQEIPGAGLGGGQIYLDSSVDELVPNLWRFLQLLTELLGLRHAKYKEALVQLSTRVEARLPDPPD